MKKLRMLAVLLSNIVLIQSVTLLTASASEVVHQVPSSPIESTDAGGDSTGPGIPILNISLNPNLGKLQGIGRDIADYGLQFVGNPYVYGGTSLTNGADCSGFTQSVFRHFNIQLPRTSGEQRYAGVEVDGLANAQPGDLITYYGHVGIYIGDGNIVHASTPREGITVSPATCKQIVSIRRVHGF